MIRIVQSVAIDAPVQAVYRQLTRFESYPRFLDEVKQVHQIDDTHLHWHTHAGNLDMEWHAEIVQQLPDRLIAWRTTGEDPHYEGQIELEPDGSGGTRLALTLECEPRQQVLAQHGDAQEAVAQRVARDLAGFKVFMEQAHDSAGAHVSRIGDARTGIARDSAPAVEAAPRSGPRPGGSAHVPRSSGRILPSLPSLPSLLAGLPGPFGVMRKVTEEMDQLIDRYLSRPLNDARLRGGGVAGGMASERSTAAPSPSGWTPAVEVAQRAQQFVVRADLPGVARDDVRVEIRRDRLTIEGDRKQEPTREPGEYCRSECAYGHFYRVVALPLGADTEAASASMHDGMLEITVPLPESGRQPRRLEIGT